MKSPLIYVPSIVEAGLQLPAAQLQGFIGWKLIRGGKVIRESKMQPNLIVDSGLNALGTISPSAMLTYMNLGTGATAPANAQVSLVAEVGTARQTQLSAVVATFVAGPPDYYYRRVTYAFTELFANGNLTEVGLFQSAAAGIMWMRQLLKDNTGTPTIVVKTAADQLQITYELRWYPAAADDVQVVNISGTNYTFTSRSHYISGANPYGGVILSNGPQSSNSPALLETDVLVARAGVLAAGVTGNSNVAQAYGVGTYYRDWLTVWDVAIANFATGIGTMTHYDMAGYYNYGAIYQSSIAPKLPKTNTKKLSIYNRRIWARYP